MMPFAENLKAAEAVVKAKNEKGGDALQTSRVRALKGSKLGPANEGRTLSTEEKREIEARSRREGKI